jgi:hypothetical protein
VNMNNTSGFDWEKSGPSIEALEAFARARDDEFPQSYSGQAWRAAYRLWLAVKDKPLKEVNQIISDPYGYDKSWNWSGENGGEDLGLSGFMAGWAMNAVRQMMNLKPGTIYLIPLGVKQ